MLSPKKILGPKNYGTRKKRLGLKIFLGPKKIFGLKKFGIKEKKL